MSTIKKQIQLITKITALACAIGMILCWKLWLGERDFPSVPAFDFSPALTHPFDYLLFILTLLSLLIILILKNPQKIIITFLCLAIIMALFDLNRWQPWFYQYVLMFFILSFYNSKNVSYSSSAILCFKIMIAAIYFWSGLQKLNPNFLSDTFPWLMEPITNRLGEGSIHSFKWLGYAFPFFETVTGILLLINKTEKIGAFLAISMHLFILFVLGPLGHNYNYVVWPWNLFMIFICWLLFIKPTTVSKNDFKESIKFHNVKIVLLLFVFIPLLNFFNTWDSYLSHNLYSGNTSNGIIYVSLEVKSKLPEHIKQYVSGDDNHIAIKYWCMTELGVPPYPEKRNFKAIANTFYKYAKDSSEVYFEFIPKIKVEF